MQKLHFQLLESCLLNLQLRVIGVKYWMYKNVVGIFYETNHMMPCDLSFYKQWTHNRRSLWEKPWSLPSAILGIQNKNPKLCIVMFLWFLNKKCKFVLDFQKILSFESNGWDNFSETKKLESLLEMLLLLGFFIRDSIKKNILRLRLFYLGHRGSKCHVQISKMTAGWLQWDLVKGPWAPLLLCSLLNFKH